MMKLFTSLFVALTILVALVQCHPMTCPEMQQLVAQQMSGQSQHIQSEFLCIAFYESSWNPNEFQPKTTASGLWGIDQSYCGTLCKTCNNVYDLFNPVINAQCALAIYNTNTFLAWSTFKHGDCKYWNSCLGNTTITTTTTTSSTTSFTSTTGPVTTTSATGQDSASANSIFGSITASGYSSATGATSATSTGSETSSHHNSDSSASASSSSGGSAVSGSLI